MQCSFKSLSAYASLVSLFAGIYLPGAQAAPAEVRFVHAIPGATNLNMRMNYANAAKNVRYQKCTAYKSVAEGEYLVDITTKKEVTTVIPPSPRYFTGGMRTTVLATGSISGNPALTHIMIPILPHVIPATQARVVLINAIPDAPNVEVWLNGVQLDPALPFTAFLEPGNMAAGTYQLEVRSGGNTVLLNPTLKLKSGKTNTLVLQGTIDASDGYPVAVSNHLSK